MTENQIKTLLIHLNFKQDETDKNVFSKFYENCSKNLTISFNYGGGGGRKV